ncbi:MAG TPA: BMP family ABC transporter substrate-binding protein [Candidatus Ozemobacteraceae bacterium]
MRALLRIVLVALLVVLSTAVSAQDATAPAAGKKIKAGFVYVGPIGDFGWTNAHELARQHVVKLFPWLETTFVESVAEGDCARVIDRLVNEEQCNVIFTTSFGYMNDTAAAAARYPDRTFMHCSGYKRGPNLGTYFAELYQAYYLNGLMAGALSKSGKLGYVAAHPIPEIVRHINAFALGAREANPKARVQVKWLFSWYDPAKAREAAEALVAEGCDALAFSEDSPAVIQVGEEHTQKGKPVFTFSHYSPMQKFGEHSVVSGQLVDWSVMYESILTALHTETWKPADHWWLLGEGACRIGGAPDVPVNPAFIEPLKAVPITDPVIGATNIYDLVFKRLAQMSEPTVLFDPFTGPIKDQAGTVRIKAGERASHDQLWAIDWFVEGVDATLPK